MIVHQLNPKCFCKSQHTRHSQWLCIMQYDCLTVMSTPRYRVEIYETPTNLINPWIYEIHEIWGFIQGFTSKSEDLTLKHGGFHDERMNRSENYEDLTQHEKSNHSHRVHLQIFASQMNRDCVIGNLTVLTIILIPRQRWWILRFSINLRIAMKIHGFNSGNLK